eukprot:gene8811-18236_t
MEKKTRFPVVVNDFIAGSFAGCASILAGHPIDTLKVRLQSSNIYKGGIDCFYQILSKEGIFALFRGIYPPLITVSFMSAAVFSTYGCTLKYMKGQKETASYSDIFISGGSSGVTAAIILCPSELIKIQQQADSKLRIWDCILNSTKSHGVQSLFRGFWPTLYRETPAYAVYFTTYQFLIVKMQIYSKLDSLSISFLSGALAGVCSWLVIYPIDVIKTNMQLRSASSNEISTMSMIRHLTTKYGWRFLFRGLNVTIFRALPVNAVVFPSYDFTIRILESL